MRWIRCAGLAALTWTCAGWLAITHAEDRPAAAVVRDGSHDFDFNVGTWKSEIRRVLDPLAGGQHTVELHGIVTVRPVWSGRAQIEEIDAEGPQGRMQGMTLFLYNPASAQWSQSWFDGASGVFGGSLVGALDAGGGVLYGADTVGGRAILVRAVWSDITRDAHRFEESFSDDGGRTWHPAFTAHLTRVAS